MSLRPFDFHFSFLHFPSHIYIFFPIFQCRKLGYRASSVFSWAIPWLDFPWVEATGLRNKPKDTAYYLITLWDGIKGDNCQQNGNSSGFLAVWKEVEWVQAPACHQPTSGTEAGIKATEQRCQGEHSWLWGLAGGALPCSAPGRMELCFPKIPTKAANIHLWKF